MTFRSVRLVRQRFGIVRIAAGAFEDLAALDLPDASRALAAVRGAEERVAVIAGRLREEAFAAIRGCDDATLRRRLLEIKRDLFNGRRVDGEGLPLPHAEAYCAAVIEADAACARFADAFDREVAAARAKLHQLAESEALQHPLALSSLALLAQIRRRITPHAELAVMKYVSRMHTKTSPFSTFCPVAVATFAPQERVMEARLGEARVSVQANRTKWVREEESFFEDSALTGEVVCDARVLDAITETMCGYVRDLGFSDPAIYARAELRRDFERRYGREGVVPLERVYEEAQTGVSVLHGDDAVARWTAALASRLELDGDRVYIDRQHVDYAFEVVPGLRRESPRSVAAMLQLTADGAVLNGCGPGHGKQVSRFLNLLPEAVLAEQRALNRSEGSRLVEFDDGSLLNMNLHPPLVDGEIGESDVPDLAVKIGDDDTLRLWHVPTNQRLEVVDLGLQDRATRSPLHQFLNTFFSPAREIIRRPMVNAALAVSGGGMVRPRVIYDRRLIIRRKSWNVPKAKLPIRARGESDAAYFARVDGWRTSLGMPAYVFVKIHRAARRDDRKPQFISFTGWHSVGLLEKLFARVVDRLKVQEMLPAPADMLEWNGRHHAIEFVVQWNRE